MARRAPHSGTLAPKLQRKCSCGGSCESCRKKKLKLQRRSLASAPDLAPGKELAPPVVHQVLRQSGGPLDRGTRREMESRFGHDLGSIRIHADSRAAESAAAVGAEAY
ncbi:MAG: DUF4157 domain-containing protein, partial [Acidobacteria bacterium]|nr:DUF4157 domain-containing protein [Acidobacteriota bacterium]